MDIPEKLLYTSEHEWVAVEDNIAIIGITDYAQGELGDIVFVEMPAIGDKTEQKEPFGAIEAVKAVSELFAPLNGEVVAINDKLEEQAELINSDPYGEGWIIKVKIENESELADLLSPEDYRATIE